MACATLQVALASRQHLIDANDGTYHENREPMPPLLRTRECSHQSGTFADAP